MLKQKAVNSSLTAIRMESIKPQSDEEVIAVNKLFIP